jgi:beta-N-acetylhexosaminidase
MALDEPLGHVMMVGFDGLAPSQQITEMIARHQIAGVILFARNVHDARQVRALTRALQAVARHAGHAHPLLVAMDQENGIVRRLGPGTTQFPGSMALGAAGSEQLTREVARATGRELRALGVTLNLAPVADVNHNPANPAVGVRAFGDDPEQVARMVAAAVAGYREAGVLACLKHFPGHGDTAVDSHVALPVIPHALERLDSVELAPFRTGLAAGADAVMVAHVALPLLTGSATLPATVAAPVARGLLRERLGFAGVAISDCLEMRAFSATVGTEQGAVMALRAGIDLLLVSHHYERQVGSLAALRTAIETGALAAEVMREASERVARLRARACSWEEALAPAMADDVADWVGGAAHRHLAERAYEQAVTLVRDDAGLMPLRLAPEARVLVIAPRSVELTAVEGERREAGTLAQSMRRRHARVDELTLSWRPTDAERAGALRQAADADLVVVMTTNAHRNPDQAELVRALLRTGKRVIGVAAREPYDLLAFPNLATYLATYEDTPPALEVAARALWGEIQPRGRLPVSLPGLYPRGHRHMFAGEPADAWPGAQARS